jgi:hypothetical protein
MGSRPTEHAGGFSLARLKYTGGGDWYSDETSLVNLLNALRAKGEVRVGQDKEAVVTATDPDLWNYPMLFVTGHGNVKLNDEELRSLRRYLDQGGFLWADDNFGMDKSFRELMRSTGTPSSSVHAAHRADAIRERRAESTSTRRAGAGLRGDSKRAGRGSLHLRLRHWKRDRGRGHS